MVPRIDAGQIIAERYELTRPLGRGSMGEVWVAHHRTLGEDVALKLLTRSPVPEEVEDPSTAIARFRFEAQVAARLSRKTRHIVRVTDNGEEGGLAYLVMELLEGEPLMNRLLRSGPLDLPVASKVVAQIARALTEAHAAGVMHRDLKPANVFLARDEDGELLVKLLDFGIARTMASHRVVTPFSTAPGLVFGTPGYMSPEQAFFSPEVDHRCDLWALATIAYEVLTNELPLAGVQTQELLASLFSGRIVSVLERDPRLPDTLDGFFKRAFAAKVEDRFASASELAQAFERAARPDGNAQIDSVAAAPSSEKGNTLSITLPMRGRQLPFVPTRGPGRARSRLLVVSAALLIGLAAFGTAWRALALRSTRTATPSVQAVLEAADVLGTSNDPAVSPESAPSTELATPEPPSPRAAPLASASTVAPVRQSAARPAARVVVPAPAVPSAPTPSVPPPAPRVPVDPSAIL
jgi:serine/threonine protein kinase